MRVFISHSNRDASVARLLVDLLRLALNLRVEDIRCSSVEGYRLPGGTSTDETLREEVHSAELLIGLITPRSIASAYVLFELGARWGAGKTLIPLLASGATLEHLKGPLSGINALSCAIPDQVHQFLEEAALHLGLSLAGASSYHKALSALASASGGLAQEASAATTDARASMRDAELSVSELRLMQLLASGAVDGDREIPIRRLPEMLNMSQVKLDVIMKKLKDRQFIDHRTSNSQFIGLTTKGAEYLMGLGLL